MVEATRAACINHPAVEATGRCKQCGRPMCRACTIVGPTGHFCSEPCKEKHQAFVQRAQQLESKRGGNFGMKLRKAFGSLIVVVVVAAVVLGLGYFFNVPILADITAKLLGFIQQP